MIMLGYCFRLALRSLRRNMALTALMVAVVGVGIGASMTMLTTLLAMAADPIPHKSSQLFVPQIDVWGPESRDVGANPAADELPGWLPYRDAVALMKAHRGVRQTALYDTVGMQVEPPTGNPFYAGGVATYADFFAMFEVPFSQRFRVEPSAGGRTGKRGGAERRHGRSRVSERRRSRQDHQLG